MVDACGVAAIINRSPIFLNICSLYVVKGGGIAVADYICHKDEA